MYFQNLARNDHPLNLTRPFANRAQLYVPIKFLRRIVLDKPVAAEQLHSLIADAHSYLTREQFCHRRFARHLAACVLQHRGALG